jgi:hypothetical protein
MSRVDDVPDGLETFGIAGIEGPFRLSERGVWLFIGASSYNDLAIGIATAQSL